MILVLGASGFVGRALVPALVARGESVRAASRSHRAREGHIGVEWVRCDVTAPATLPAALAGVDTAYYLVHSMGRTGERDYRAAERRAAQDVADVAAASGVRRIVYLGGVAPAGPPSEHLASRLEVGEILRAGQVPTIELRASMIIGAGSTSWQIVRDLARRLPFMILPRWLESKSRPVALDDVVAALVAAREVPLEHSEWFDIPGPETLTAREILFRVAALDRRRIPAVGVPLLTPRLSAMWLALVTSADYGVARELVLGLTTDLLPRDERYWKLIGHAPRKSFDEAARLALAAEPHAGGLRGVAGRLEESLVRRLGPHARRGVVSSFTDSDDARME